MSGMHLSQKDLGCIRKARKLLIQNVTQHITIPELSREAGINQFKLKKGFKMLYGTSIYRYLLNKRLMRAKELLKTTHLPVYEISRRVGYPSASNLSSAFRKAFNISPGRWRRKNRPVLS